MDKPMARWRDNHYTIIWRDSAGVERIAEGVSLAQIAENLHEQGYDGASIRVHDSDGWTIGWVGRGGHYRYS